jgi:hypothetical protein
MSVRPGDFGVAKSTDVSQLGLNFNSEKEVIQVQHQKSTVSRGFGSLRFLAEQPL